MSVLIKDMEMPGCCAICDVVCRYYLERGLDGLLAKICRTESRLPDCPLVSVPPHGRCIDADELKDLYSDCNDLDLSNFNVKVAIVRQNIDDMPTILEAEEEK